MSSSDAGTETRWFWVRHAPVPDGGNIYGQADLDCDCSDAEIFAALARELPGDAVWIISHLGRTRQTADAIMAARALGAAAVLPVDLTAVPELAEQHLGDWQGLNRKAFFAGRGVRHHSWFGPASERAPNGESFDDVVARVSTAVQRLTVQFAGRDIVAVAHGGSIRAALALALGLDAEGALSFIIENCSITRIDHIAGVELRHGWRVAAVNHRPWSRGFAGGTTGTAAAPTG